MSNLEGTHWVRNKDNALVVILGDPLPVGSSRSLLAQNRMTGRKFWVTPEGLGRKYTAVEEADL